MLGLVKEISGQKTIVPLTTDTGTGAPVGTLISQYKKVPMSGYLYCDGSTFDETAYPALYLYLGSNVLPDYRECVMVGAEQNTTDTIVEHDVYTQGQFKDDQLQTHNHGAVKVNGEADFGVIGDPSWSEPSVYSTTISGGSNNTISLSVGNNTGRSGTTTHGKQKAVYVYIKATSGLAENQQENVLNAVKNYTYSKYDNTTGFQRSFIKVGNVGTYTRIYNLPAGDNRSLTEDLSSTFSVILGVLASPDSFGGRYPTWYWLNNNNAVLDMVYTTASDSLLVVQVTGVLQENYADPF
jgi:microcystin-dependent protein